MAKYKVTVTYQGSVDIVVDAESPHEAKALGYVKFDEVPAMEIDANICDLTAEAYEMDAEEDSSDSLDQ